MKHPKPAFMMLLTSAILAFAGWSCASSEQVRQVTQVVPVTQIVPVTQVVPVTQIVPATEVSLAGSGTIPFTAPGDPSRLNPALIWQPGDNPQNAYDLSAGPAGLTLVAGARTDQWIQVDTAPKILYAINGDFSAEVTIGYSPEVPFQVAGLGVESEQNNWVRLIRRYGDGQQIGIEADRQGGEYSQYTAYAEDGVHFKVERQGSAFILSYSRDGVDWSALTADFQLEMPSRVLVYLVAFSAKNDRQTAAQFSDLIVTQK